MEQETILKTPSKRKKAGSVMSFFADAVLRKHILVEAARTGQDKSSVIRLILRRHFGLRESGLPR